MRYISNHFINFNICNNLNSLKFEYKYLITVKVLLLKKGFWCQDLAIERNENLLHNHDEY